MSFESLHITDELLVKFLLNECDTHEVELVQEWLKASAENAQYFDQFKLIWDESKQLASSTDVDSEAAWLRLKEKMNPPKSSWQINRRMYSIAAAILILVSLFTFYRWMHREQPLQLPPIVHQEKTIESKSNTRIDTLSDRSVVTMNKHAVLNCPVAFTGKERRVALKGEAFFNITPNKEKPFYIDASNHVEIRVVGTSFNVKSFDAYTEVVVETGIVQVKQFEKVILLHPNERARLDAKDSTIVVEKSNDKLYKYYRSKEFECDNTPLWKVVEVLNEAYGDSIVIGRNELRSLTITTRFDNESLSQILDVISETFEITVEKKGNKYILK